MKAFAVVFAMGSSFALPAHAADWTCSAPGLVSANYDGGDGAYIHLSGFSDGKVYPVKKAGNRASGTTSNGTKFSCVKK